MADIYVYCVLFANYSECSEMASQMNIVQRSPSSYTLPLLIVFFLTMPDFLFVCFV